MYLFRLSALESRVLHDVRFTYFCSLFCNILTYQKKDLGNARINPISNGGP